MSFDWPDTTIEDRSELSARCCVVELDTLVDNECAICLVKTEASGVTDSRVENPGKPCYWNGMGASSRWERVVTKLSWACCVCLVVGNADTCPLMSLYLDFR